MDSVSLVVEFFSSPENHWVVGDVVVVTLFSLLVSLRKKASKLETLQRPNRKPYNPRTFRR